MGLRRQLRRLGKTDRDASTTPRAGKRAAGLLPQVHHSFTELMSQSAWLANSRNVLLTVLKPRSLRPGCPLSGHRPLLCPQVAEGTRELGGVSCIKARVHSYVPPFVTPWTVARQAPLSMRFSRQEYWSGLHFLLQRIFLTQGFNLCPLCHLCLLCLLHWPEDSLPLHHLQALITFMRLYHQNLITSQRPHLPTPSSLRIKISAYAFWGTQIAVHSSHEC